MYSWYKKCFFSVVGYRWCCHSLGIFVLLSSNIWNIWPVWKFLFPYFLSLKYLAVWVERSFVYYEIKAEYFSAWLLFIIGLGISVTVNLRILSLLCPLCSTSFSLILQGGRPANPFRKVEATFLCLYYHI